MPTLLDVMIGLPILIIRENQRLRHERFLFYLEVFVAFRSREPRSHLVLVEGPDAFGYEFVPEEEAEPDDPFSGPPLQEEQILPGGVQAHVN